MRRRLLGILLLLIVPGAACSRSATGPDGMTLEDGSPAVLILSDPASLPYDGYEFVAMRLAGDTLIADIRHGGGCERHEFALVITPVFLESLPVQVHGALAHDAKDDPCRALLSVTLRLDLSPLRELYFRTYGRHAATIVLHVRDWPDAVRYSFEP